MSHCRAPSCKAVQRKKKALIKPSISAARPPITVHDISAAVDSFHNLFSSQIIASILGNRKHTPRAARLPVGLLIRSSPPAPLETVLSTLFGGVGRSANRSSLGLHSTSISLFWRKVSQLSSLSQPKSPRMPSCCEKARRGVV